MRVIAKNMEHYLANSSWIRRMFELGTELKKEYGAENVYDFSLGNPDLPAPPEVGEALRNFAVHADEAFAFGYMPNGGFPWLREKLASYLSLEQNIKLSKEDVILANGAAGALNVFFKATLNPGSEVLTFAPYFVEYGFYCENHGGKLITVPSKQPDFAPDPAALEPMINKATSALLINSPHNPTGVVYTETQLKELVRLLEKKSAEFGHAIWLIADEPYRFLTYDGVKVPPVLPLYKYAVVISSLSKNLSMPGERIGYIAISPNLPEKQELMAALTLANRILGFVNPPVIGQNIMAQALGATVDISVYEKRRNTMARVLKEGGYDFIMPKGAFYFFPKAPGNDDVAFVKKLLEERILAVPGSGFGCPGHFRLAFCVDASVIEKAADGFAKAARS